MLYTPTKPENDRHVLHTASTVGDDTTTGRATQGAPQ